MKKCATVQSREWAGSFGTRYTKRNTMGVRDVDRVYRDRYGVTRTELNERFLKNIHSDRRVLEVGINAGNQLLMLKKMGFTELYGIEINAKALLHAQQRVSGASLILGNALDIPFKDNYFHMVYTSGVLIHIDPKNIKQAISEIHRCAKDYIWGLEYDASGYQHIAYRGKKKMLWKTNFAKLFLDEFSDLRLVKTECVPYLDSENVDRMYLLKKVKPRGSKK